MADLPIWQYVVCYTIFQCGFRLYFFDGSSTVMYPPSMNTTLVFANSNNKIELAHIKFLLYRYFIRRQVEYR
jgi:hypothetical protein